jgi:hypothetical protein
MIIMQSKMAIKGLRNKLKSPKNNPMPIPINLYFLM